MIRRPAGRRALQNPLSLRHPGHAHSLNGTLAPSREGRIAVACIGGNTKAANGEVRIERKSRLRGDPRLIQSPEQRQRGGKIEMREGKIAVGLDASAQPSDRFRVGTKLKLGNAYKR